MAGFPPVGRSGGTRRLFSLQSFANVLREESEGGIRRPARGAAASRALYAGPSSQPAHLPSMWSASPFRPKLLYERNTSKRGAISLGTVVVPPDICADSAALFGGNGTRDGRRGQRGSSSMRESGPTGTTWARGGRPRVRMWGKGFQAGRARGAAAHQSVSGSRSLISFRATMHTFGPVAADSAPGMAFSPACEQLLLFGAR